MVGWSMPDMMGFFFRSADPVLDPVEEEVLSEADMFHSSIISNHTQN
jgi:hypothetical protein